MLENPDSISKRVLEKGLDAGTAFEILSIDIADIDVGDNIGANLQADQAEADTRVARAKAEERRAFAVAMEQEMIAAVQENRAKVVAGRGRGPAGHRRGLPQGQPRHHRLLQPPQHPGRHRDAVGHRRHRAERPPRAGGHPDPAAPCGAGTQRPRLMQNDVEVLIKLIIPAILLIFWALSNLFNRENAAAPAQARKDRGLAARPPARRLSPPDGRATA